MYPTIHRGMLLTLGIRAGLVCLKLLALVVGLAYVSALGLLMSGHWGLAILILVAGQTLYGGLRYLFFGRRR
jgi:hypothetical protein